MRIEQVAIYSEFCTECGDKNYFDGQDWIDKQNPEIFVLPDALWCWSCEKCFPTIINHEGVDFEENGIVDEGREEL